MNCHSGTVIVLHLGIIDPYHNSSNIVYLKSQNNPYMLQAES